MTRFARHLVAFLALALSALVLAGPASALSATKLSFTTRPVLPMVGKTYAIGVTSNRPGPIVLATSTPSVCTVVGFDVTIVSRGQCDLAADQAATVDYAAGHAELTLWVVR